MAAGSDIRAGRAFVELYANNSRLIKGLAEATQRLRNFGNGISLVGKWMMGLGAAALAPLALMTKRFESTGSQLNDMAARTGMSVEALSELGYAAGQTGASLEDVETGIRKMQKSMPSGGLTPAKQFEQIAAKINAMEDPTKKAALAMEAFGKSGTKLLPMIADLSVLRARAYELGLVMSTEDAAAADSLGDALSDLKKSILGAGNSLIASLAPSMTLFVNRAVESVGVIRKWINANKETIVSAAKITLQIVAAGAGLFVFGKAIAGVGALLGGLQGFIMWAVGGIQGLISIIGIAAGAIFSIHGALILAGAGMLYLARNTAPVQAVGEAIAGFFSGLRQMLSTIVDDAKMAWDGIAAALKAGDIGAAVRVVTATITLEWARVTSWLTETWDYLVMFWTDVTSSLEKIMLESCTGIQIMWAETIGFLKKLWIDWTNSDLVKNFVYGFTAIVATIEGIPVKEALQSLDEQYAESERTAGSRKKEIDAKTVAERDRLGQELLKQQTEIQSSADATKKSHLANIALAQTELEKAKKARDEAVNAAKEAGKNVGGLEAPKLRTPEFDAAAFSAAKSAATTTFSATALRGMGAQTVQERIAKAAEKSTKLEEQINAHIENINKRMQKFNVALAD